MTPTRTQFIERRRTGIGGSDMAAILGVSPWKTPFNVWQEKVEGGPAIDLPSVRMRVGTHLEDLAAKMYEEETGRKVRRCNVLLSGDRHRIGNVDRLVCLPDGSLPWTRKGGVRAERALEIKTSSDLSEWETVPDHYLAQIYHYMGLMPSVKVFDVPVLFLARGTFRIYEVERDDATIENEADAAGAFWENHVATRIPPVAETEEDARSLWPRHAPGKIAVATAETEEAAAQMRALTAALKETESKIDALKVRLQGAMQDAETLVLPDGRKLATWTTAKDREVVDWKAAASDIAGADPAILLAAAERHTTVKPGARSFRLSPIK